MPQPVKPFAGIDEQIEVLSSRGLELDSAVAAQWLRAVGYYRLSGYWYPYRAISGPQGSRRGDRFVAGAHLDDVSGCMSSTVSCGP
jgi:abortive infection bacteriophage resistance protein